MTEAAPPEKRARPWGLVILLVGGVAVGIALALVTSASPPGADRPAARPGSYDLPLTVRELQPGQQAPDFAARTPAGETIRLRDLRGSLVALNFWATWCEPCKIEMPELQRAAVRYAGDGLIVLGVNQAEPAAEVQAFMQEHGLTFPTVLDADESIADRYGVLGLPTTYWIDVEGVVRAKHIGMLDASLIDRYIADLMETRPG